ncbi:magnesium transport [Pyrenophora seminiperda CCB06]|uniref:Magnesium transport n=1 Tax=Pyrenophora seminiperda CCB06 TaxID=1302712 RepID=A0A3M7MI90_9PLEO|nr:magnesium transport [Pyrenophora seminiperda CCB06]
MFFNSESTNDMPTKTNEIPALLSPNNIPHSPGFPDPYVLIGDAGKYQTPMVIELVFMQNKSLSTSWKTLRHLADWMQVGTTPLRYNVIKQYPEEMKRRAEKTNATLIEYQTATAPETTLIKSASGLHETLQSLSHDGIKEPSLLLFVVEDLSQQVIELLGKHFDIDPLFFREQIDNYVWHNTRDPWASPPSLLSSTKHRQWFRMRNVRLRYHTTQADYQDSRLEAEKWNVLRRPDNDETHWHYRDKKGSVVSIMRTRTTVWIGEDKKGGNGTVGIVLLDPTVTQGRPLWYDRSNWLPTPSIKTKVYPNIRSSISWFEDIVQMTSVFPWFERTEGHKINPKVLVKPIMYTICAEWLVICDYVKSRLSQIEWELEMPDIFRSKGDVIDTSLNRLDTWRRQIPVFREMLEETLEQALPAAVRLTASSSQLPAKTTSPLSTLSLNALSTLSDNLTINLDNLDAFEDIVSDFRRVLAALNELQERVDRLTGIVTSEISIEDSRRGLKENHNMARIRLATIFIPLTFISGLYSMNESVAALSTTYGWYFLTAIPFTLIVMAIGWVAGGRSLRLWREGGKQRVSEWKGR